MRSTKNNPRSNMLRSGTSEEMVLDAIKQSGYPLQLEVANFLKENFEIEEEWAFPDSETNTTRTIDIVATHRFPWDESQPRARPAIAFVIECKQSDLPYVFFLSDNKHGIADYPLLGGLNKNEVRITSDDNPSSWMMNPISLFDLREQDFLRASAPSCMTFSKCVRKGKDLVLSGSDAYQNIVFPITKCMQHFRFFHKPPATAYYFDCILIVGLAVIDAPMIAVRVSERGPVAELIPWVRVIRHQPKQGDHLRDRSETLGVDIVHKDFTKDFIFEHALPFASKFATLTIKHDHVLADSKGFISGMGAQGWENFEHRLEIARSAAKAKRVRATLKSLSRQSGQ
jgi:hypothetical protein